VQFGGTGLEDFMVRAGFPWHAFSPDRLWQPADSERPSATAPHSGGGHSSGSASDAPDRPAAGVRARSESLRSRADHLLDRSAALIERSHALRDRLGRPDWPEVAVLNVEDHEPARFLRTRILENAGYTVREADSVADAIAATMADPPIRLVLVDVGLPDGDGFQLCEQIKSNRADLPVVMITSIYRSASSRRQGLELGADEYLLEPLPGHRLVGTIDRLLMDSPGGSNPAIITTDAAGTIVSLNAAAGRLLNLSVRGAIGRSLLLFVGAERDRVARGLNLAASGQVVQDEMTLVPRERKRLKVEVDLNGSEQPHENTVEWKIQPL
jgi:DNA-binding response OmpR family regulator